jgi:hypothetical protein
MLAPVQNFLTTSPYGTLVIMLVILMAVLLVVVPLIGKFRRKSLKKKETREIMKDLLTWRHLAQLVKGGEEHSKAKQELSDNIVRISELLKQGIAHTTRNIQNLYNVPCFVVLGEPRSGKSTLLSASDMELVPSTEENNLSDDPKSSLPVRVWTGATAVLYDISGKVFFDRWLDNSSAEWEYIVRQICRTRRRWALDGIIITIPADSLLVDGDSLSSKKAILMANELGKLLQQSGMHLPCYVVITKLDMVNGFHEYAKAFTGDLRNQIMGFENCTKTFDEVAFERFWKTLYERLRSGSKQLIFSTNSSNEGMYENRMDRAGKVWLFPDNIDSLYKNIVLYLEILFGENNFNGTKNAFFEGVYFTSAKDMGFSFNPAIAALAEKNAEDMLIPEMNYPPAKTAAEEVVFADRSDESNNSVSSTALVTINTGRYMLRPHIQQTSLFHGYFIRDLLHKKVFVPSINTGFVKQEALRRHIPHYLLCAVMMFLGFFWLFPVFFKTDELRVSLIQMESYYEWLDSIIQKGTPFRSPLIKEANDGRFVVDNEPVEGEVLSSRFQFYYNTLTYRDMKTISPLGFKLSEAFAYGFDKNIGYRQKAFITNQLHKTMVRIPVLKNAGIKLLEQTDNMVLDNETREVIVAFVSLDRIQGVDFYKYFTTSQFKFDSMLRFLMPEISNDTMELLNSYKPKYDRSYTFQMDIDYIYSDEYRIAKQAALDTILSAWRRRAVYPDSIYGKVKRLASISQEIAANYLDITGALNRINGVYSLTGVEEAVYEWKWLTDRHKSLSAGGRAVFEEIRILMKAAHIPLGFESAPPQVNLAAVAGGGSADGILKRPVMDAFGNNLINDYLFNDLVINYAVKEYVKLFEADMEFVEQETSTGGNEILGYIISEQNTFSGSLIREVDELREQARILQDNELLSQKLDDKPESPSLFMVIERVLALSSDIPVPRRETARDVNFEINWQRGQVGIKTAMDDFDAFVKPYRENNKLSVLIANTRVMMLAEAYYNRYVIFTTSLSFLNTFEGNIAAVIESRSDNTDLFSFSGNAIQNLFGGFYYNKGYNPREVKIVVDNIVSFAALFNPGEDSKNLPLFLQNVDRRIYQPQPFMDYLASYIKYWGNYPERVYVSAGSWEHFMGRAAEYKSFQINSVLLSVYTTSLEAVNQLDNSLLNESLLALKNNYTASLGDSLALLSQFYSADAEKMFLAWNKLSADPLEAYAFLQSLPEEDLRNSYLTVYTTEKGTLGIGWWNSFVIDGVSILARHVDNLHMEQLIANINQYKAYPLCTDAARSEGLSFDMMQQIASLFGSLGAGLPDLSEQDERDPVSVALHHNLFKGAAVRSWAKNIYQIADAITSTQKPLRWTIYQVPEETQRKLRTGKELPAINRFRYVQVSSTDNVPRMSSTYMNEKLVLLQGDPESEALAFNFYKTSRDSIPGAVVTFNGSWTIFELYLQENRIADDEGNNYIPVYLGDETGQYVYYLDIGFNTKLPDHLSWYSSRDWPSIMIADNFITEKVE